MLILTLLFVCSEIFVKILPKRSTAFWRRTTLKFHNSSRYRKTVRFSAMAVSKIIKTHSFYEMLQLVRSMTVSNHCRSSVKLPNLTPTNRRLRTFLEIITTSKVKLQLSIMISFNNLKNKESTLCLDL